VSINRAIKTCRKASTSQAEQQSKWLVVSHGHGKQLPRSSCRRKEVGTKFFVVLTLFFLNEQARVSAYFIDEEERLQIRLTGEVQKRFSMPELLTC